jgi:hypothetical protein
VPLGHFAKHMQVYLAFSNDLEEGNVISTFGVKIGCNGFAKYLMLELLFGSSSICLSPKKHCLIAFGKKTEEKTKG